MPFTGKILLIDDEPHIRKYLALIARGLGAPVIIGSAKKLKSAWHLKDVQVAQLGNDLCIRACLPE